MVRIVRSAAAALALVIAVPSMALADTTPAPAAAKKADKAGKAGKRGNNKADKAKSFPMKAEAFKEKVEKRIAKARAKLGEILERNSVPAAMRTEVMKDFDAGATAVRAATDRVSKDGTVTQDEAKEVRDLAKDLKQKAREKYGLGGKAKGKGKSKA